MKKMFIFSNTSSSALYSPTSNTLEPMTPSTSSFSTQLHQHLKQVPPSSFLQQQQKNNFGCSSLPLSPSILDSPTLVRVERARIRLEASKQQQYLNDSCGSIPFDVNHENLKGVSPDEHKQSLLGGQIPVSLMTGPIKRGLLWQQRDRLFSRWKERFFVLTRDYLHCFKRASGSANERASEMGQFIFKVKLVDIDKVEWLNRRSYSALGLLLGREGRVLLRCNKGLEDWFELLEECTITSKERRKALKIAQSPRSRVSIAVPVSHASLNSNRSGFGSTDLSALADLNMINESGVSGDSSKKLITNSMCGDGGTNPFIFSDSVTDLSDINNENHNHIRGFSTNHSTHQKILCLESNNNRYSQNSSFSNCDGIYSSSRHTFISKQIVAKSEESEVELRHPQLFRHMSTEYKNEFNKDWLYRKPKAPTDVRHSVQPLLPAISNAAPIKQIYDLDYFVHDSGLVPPPLTHNVSSNRKQTQDNNHALASNKDMAESSISSTFKNMLHNSSESYRNKQLQEGSSVNQLNGVNRSRYSVQERVLKTRDEVERCCAITSVNSLSHKELYDPNHNQLPVLMKSQHDLVKMQSLNFPYQQTQYHHQLNGKGNAINNNNDNAVNGNTQNFSAVFRERYQHPALTAIANEFQGIKYRDRSYSDCQQMPTRRNIDNNQSPLTSRRKKVNAIFGTKV